MRSSLLSVLALFLSLGTLPLAPAEEEADAVDVALRKIEEEYARIRAAGEPLHLSDLVFEPIPDEENGASLWVEAAAKSSELEPVEEERIARLVDPCYVSWEESVASEPFDTTVERVGELLEKHREALEAARVAAGRARCRFPVEVAKGFAMELPHLPAQRHLAILLGAKAVHLARTGRIPEAYEWARVGFACGDALAGEPVLVGQLARSAIYGIVLEGLSAILSIEPPSPEETRIWIGTLAEMADQDSFLRCFLVERCMEIDVLEKILADPKELQKLTGEEIEIPEGTGDFVRRFFARDHLCYLEYLRGVLEQRGVPWCKGIERCGELTQEWESAAKEGHFVLCAMLAPASSACLGHFANSRTRLDLARVSLAVVLFAVEGGRVPENLDPLVPSRLPELPVDSLTGKLLLYRVDEGEIRIAVDRAGLEDGYAAKSWSPSLAARAHVPPIRVEDEAGARQAIGKWVEIRGVAIQPKLAPAVESGGLVVYFPDLEAWTTHAAGQRMEVQGELVFTKGFAAGSTESGAAAAGTEGGVYVVRRARLRILMP